MAHGARVVATELSGTFAKSYGHAHGSSTAANLARLRGIFWFFFQIEKKY